MSSYATVADLMNYGAPVQSFRQGANPISDPTLQAELDAASTLADGYIEARGQLPLLMPYPQSLVIAVCKIAAYSILSVRGLNPSVMGDTNLRDRHDDSMRWLEKVQKQQFSVTGFNFSPEHVARGHQQPFVSSMSRIAPGRWAKNRGW
jgi:phage gp36-like protein